MRISTLYLVDSEESFRVKSYGIRRQVTVFNMLLLSLTSKRTVNKHILRCRVSLSMIIEFTWISLKAYSNYILQTVCYSRI